jgi:hypothetical protein
MKTKRPRTARELTIWGIHRGMSNAEIAARIKREHPRSPTTAATVNYIRNEIRKGDKSVKSDRAVRKGSR